MSQVASVGAEPVTLDPYEIGWYIEAADEEIYGPVSRDTLRRFLEEKTITPNTLIRHCTQPEARPVADQAVIREYVHLEGKGSAVGDRLAEAWPRKKRDQQALADGKTPCAWHKRPAVAVCVRCHAPYCNRCRQKPYHKQFYLCRRCHVGTHNRRFIALVADTFLLFYLPLIVVVGILGVAHLGEDQMAMLLYPAYTVFIVIYFFLRDSLFRGASPGKRMTGLRVVTAKDGTTPLSYGQGFVRWLSQFIPIFSLVDALIPYYDPLLRRYGDRWAGTRVIDNDRKLAKARAKITKRLLKKGVQPAQECGMTMEQFARLA